MKQRNFKCTGCGAERPCFFTFHHEDHNVFDNFEDDLKCLVYTYLESEDPSNWREVKHNKNLKTKTDAKENNQKSSGTENGNVVRNDYRHYVKKRRP